MLSLFKDEDAPLGSDHIKSRCRELLMQGLNKGSIPSWENYFQDLPTLSEASDLEEIKANFFKLTEWEFLNDVFEKDSTEYFFHSPTSSQRLKLSGEKETIHLPISEEDWQLWLEIISIRFRQNWNVKNPFCSFYGTLLGQSFRISLVHFSTSPQGKSKLVLRALSQKPHALNSFGETEILKTLVKEKRNVLVAGSTGSGKTSVMTSMLLEVDPEEHLVILEDTFEILSQHEHQTRFLAGDSEEKSLKAYLSYSLRISPDRIILGEMRSHEVVPFLMAMNTGHKGLMGTIHASSASDSLNRMALLFSLYAGEANLNFEKVMELICRNLEYVVFMEKKKVTEVIRILGSDKGIPFFETVIDKKNPVSDRIF